MIRVKQVRITCWEDALVESEEGNLGYTPVGTEREVVATVPEAGVDIPVRGKVVPI